MTKVNLAYKGRLFTTEEQERMLRDNFQLAKSAYNWARGRCLAQFEPYNKAKEEFKQTLVDKGLSKDGINAELKKWSKENTSKYIDEARILSTSFTQERKQRDYYKDLDGRAWVSKATASFAICLDFNNALSKFWKELSKNSARVYRKQKKNKKKVFKFPQHYGFPQRKDDTESITYALTANAFDYENNRVNISKIGWIKISHNQPLPVFEIKKQKYVRIGFDGKHYFITIPYTMEMEKLETKKTPILGVDIGLTYLAVLSDGTYIENISKTPKYQKLMKRIDKLNRKKCWLVEHSPKSWNIEDKKKKWKAAQSKQMRSLDTRIKKCYVKMNQIKNNYMHEQAEMIVKRNPECIIFEHLDVKGMQEEKTRISKYFQQTAVSTFKTIVTWHATKHGIPVKEADQYFSSNKTCSHCGNINEDFTGLNVTETFRCPYCGMEMNRRENTALNLLNIYDTIKTVTNADALAGKTKKAS
jgi:putative transposase